MLPWQPRSDLFQFHRKPIFLFLQLTIYAPQTYHIKRNINVFKHILALRCWSFIFRPGIKPSFVLKDYCDFQKINMFWTKDIKLMVGREGPSLQTSSLVLEARRTLTLLENVYLKIWWKLQTRNQYILGKLETYKKEGHRAYHNTHGDHFVSFGTCWVIWDYGDLLDHLRSFRMKMSFHLFLQGLQDKN